MAVADVASIPNADDMDNETFLRHMDKRHSHEVLNGPLLTDITPHDNWVRPYRAFHDGLHLIAMCGVYDHEHVW